ncbi:hypothetical protein TSUD_329370 [Trifolium subterraneum]|uniref:TIR domain-containing protein n=1 Tax=Trifolium subterraneum TaxID=3900 RepID=A0A2Z6PDX0_TRISU|nr:hypothetical protein TSUD_329370 [Trifolium subterraneum]
MASSGSSSTNQDSEPIFSHDMNRSSIYDVFLSFYDVDTGDSFPSYLYTALREAAIYVKLIEVFRVGFSSVSSSSAEQSFSFTLLIFMASSSSSSTNQDSESIFNNDMNQSWTYDVFLSFCDKDTADSFASYLYTALTVAGVVVFRDGDNLSNQDQAPSNSVLHAIESSRISIVIFSKKYADSTWCLQELDKIMECYKTKGQKVVPVFYDVNPSSVLHQEGMLGEAFKDLKQRILNKDEFLRELGNISGFTVDSRNESKDIKSIVQHATRLLDKTYLFVADYPVGLESRLQDVIQLLDNKQPEHTLIVGICGQGGSGKTTMAKAIYNRMGCNFEAKSILLNVSHVCDQINGHASLREQLLSDIYKGTKIKPNTMELDKNKRLILNERLPRRKIFLVLDDVWNLDECFDLCGSREWLGQGSRIIITSGDKQLLHELGADSVYTITPLCINESLELLSWHAFKQPSVVEGFSDVSRHVAEYCQGVPLYLEIIGSFLSTRRRKPEWESVLQKLATISNTDPTIMMMILRIIYDGLSDNDVKEIFFDISFNLSGMDRDDVIQILKEGGHSAENGLGVLLQQRLVTVDSKNRIEMHDLVKIWGRAIIGEKSQGTAEERIYDVFLSFRGEDCRAKFISHLYASLQNAGIYVFKDDDGIQRGDTISLSLIEAIGKSRMCIVVLSSNYANSRSCLLELEKIMNSARSGGLVVIPVFYEVDPSEVRHQTGKFGEAFENLTSRISRDKYRKSIWETALLEIGGTAGIVIVNSRSESEDITNVVDNVTELLDRTDLFIADHPVGVESRVQDVIQQLKSQQSKDSLLIGIWGMGGIGKTTIAKAVYNEIRHDYEAKSFLLNVREVWEQDNGEVSLQQRLLSDIFKTTKIKIGTVESGKMILHKRLSQKRIFLVLDDVNKLDQLNALCGSREWFGQGSTIIITTRDDDLLLRLKVDHVYRLKEMDGNESLELFSWNAFKQPIPIEGFADLCRDFVKYSGGLPLALQVIGSFLMTRRRKKEWKSVLEKLKLIPNEKVLGKLRISFDGLSDDDIKEIFLDISFFFIGMDREDVIKILDDCGHYADIGISVLVQRSLVTVDRNNKIGMHDLLQDMGREIVSKKSTEGNKEPSRLWRYEELNSALSKDTRTLDVKGLTLKISRTDSTSCLETKPFQKMDKLKLLQLAGFLKKLKFLNLSHSHNLKQTPDFSNLPNLEKLMLKDCPCLSSVSPTIGHLKKILLINLKDCTGLRELPRSIYKLESLKTLIVSGCKNIDKLEEDIEQMTSLTTLAADNTAITRVPFAVVRSKSIGYISLCGFKGFARNVFPSIIQSWMSPTNGVLSLVQTFAGTSSLEFLDEQNDSFYGLPSIFKDLQDLQRLWLKFDSEVQLNQTLANILHNLQTRSCEELETMQNTPQSSNFVTSASTHCCSQVQSSSSQNSLTSLLIQMGMNCHVTDTLRQNILQKMPPNGSGLLPGDNYPDWLSFNDNGSSVTFEVPQVDERCLKTIMCVVYSSSPDDITSEGLDVLFVINYTKNTIQLYKRDGLSATSDEEEWQKVVSNTEPGDIMQVIVVFENKFIVKKTTVYLIYDEPIDETTNHRLESDKKDNATGCKEAIYALWDWVKAIVQMA